MLTVEGGVDTRGGGRRLTVEMGVDTRGGGVELNVEGGIGTRAGGVDSSCPCYSVFAAVAVVLLLVIPP